MKLSEKKRMQIVCAAELLFAEQGVEATSMDQVAARAEVSKRTVYNHFATKTALFQSVLEAMMMQLEQGSAVDYNPNEAIASQLVHIARQEVALLSSDAFLKIAKVTFLQMLQDAELAKSLNSQSFGCLRFFEQFLLAANEDGVLCVEDIPLASKQFVYQLKSLVFYPLLYGFADKTELSLDYITNETVKLFLARYKK